MKITLRQRLLFKPRTPDPFRWDGWTIERQIYVPCLLPVGSLIVLEEDPIGLYERLEICRYILNPDGDLVAEVPSETVRWREEHAEWTDAEKRGNWLRWFAKIESKMIMWQAADESVAYVLEKVFADGQTGAQSGPFDAMFVQETHSYVARKRRGPRSESVGVVDSVSVPCESVTVDRPA